MIAIAVAVVVAALVATAAAAYKELLPLCQYCMFIHW